MVTVAGIKEEAERLGESKAAEGKAAEGKATTVKDSERAAYKAKVMELYRKQVPVNTDIGAVRNERLFPLPLFLKPYLLEMIEDPRDYIALELLVNMSVIVVPLLVLFCMYPSHLFGVALIAFKLIVFGARFFLTLHVTSHRRLFKQKYWLLNSWAGSVLAFSMGMPPGFYYIHHVMMHHCENNVFPYDISSTMPHQRDQWSELALYVSRYFTHAVLYLPYYAYKKQRYGLLAYHMVCWLAYFVFSGFLFQTYPLQVMWLVYIPFLFLGPIIMQGNYTQHIFVCPDDPFSNYKLAFNYICHPDNQITYNDGYHIVHHMSSRLHWSEMPQYFEDNIDKFAENDAFVFQGIDNNKVFTCVFGNRYDELYKHWVQLQPNNIRTVEEFERLCRHRLQPIHKSNKKSL